MGCSVVLCLFFAMSIEISDSDEDLSLAARCPGVRDRGGVLTDLRPVKRRVRGAEPAPKRPKAQILRACVGRWAGGMQLPQ